MVITKHLEQSIFQPLKIDNSEASDESLNNSRLPVEEISESGPLVEGNFS